MRTRKFAAFILLIHQVHFDERVRLIRMGLFDSREAISSDAF